MVATLQIAGMPVTGSGCSRALVAYSPEGGNAAATRNVPDHARNSLVHPTMPPERMRHLFRSCRLCFNHFRQQHPALSSRQPVQAKCHRAFGPNSHEVGAASRNTKRFKTVGTQIAQNFPLQLSVPSSVADGERLAAGLPILEVS